MLETAEPGNLLILVFWILPALMCTALAYRFAGQQHIAIVNPMIMNLTGGILFCLGNAGEMYVNDLQSLVLWVKIEYVGLALIPPAWFALARTFDARFRSDGATLSNRQYVLLMIPSLCMLLAVWSNDFHQLFWQQTFLREHSGFVLLGTERGVLPYLWELYSFAIYFFALVTFLKIAFRHEGIYRQQAISLILAFSIPFCFNLIHAVGLWPYLNITAPLIGVTAAFIVFIIVKHRLLEISPGLRRVIMMKMPDPMFAINTRNELLDYNDEAQSLIFRDSISQSHLPLQQVISTSWEPLLDVLNSDTAIQQLSLEDRIWQVRQLPLDQHENVGRILTLQDVTEQVSSGQELTRTQQRLQDLLEVLPVAVFRASDDKNGQILARNRAFDEMLTDKTPVTLGELADDEQAFNDIWLSLSQHQVTQQADLVFRNQTGQAVECSITASTRSDPSTGQTFIEGIIENIEARKRTERELISAKELAEQASEMKTAFLANMSHEIRTPLNGILPSAEILSETQLTSKQQDLVEIIRSSGSVLSRLLNDLLDVSKIEAGRLALESQPYNPAKIVRMVIERYAQAADEKGVQLGMRVSEEDESAHILGDAVRLNQIVENLVSNATKFTAKGEISVSVALTPTSNHRVEVSIEVRDSGVGISADRQANIFDAFVQEDVSTTRVYGGTGLGLTISKSLATMMQGDLRVASEAGQGSIFTLTFPAELAELRQSASAVDERSGQTESLSHLRVLVAEDEPMNRMIITEQLAHLDIEPTVVTNGNEVIEAMARQNFDLILMDCHMPIKDGYEATQELRASGIEIPIIALSANAGVLEEKKSLEFGLDMHLSKPVAVVDLTDAIRLYTPENADATRLRKQPK